jgi:hypothetical protein
MRTRALDPEKPKGTSMKIKTKSRIDHLEVLLRGVREASRFNEMAYRIRKYLGSFDARLHATLEAYDAMKREDRPDPAELPSIAKSLDAWKGTEEPALVHRIPKDSPGQYRTVSNSASKTEPSNT